MKRPSLRVHIQASLLFSGVLASLLWMGGSAGAYTCENGSEDDDSSAVDDDSGDDDTWWVNGPEAWGTIRVEWSVGVSDFMDLAEPRRSEIQGRRTMPEEDGTCSEWWGIQAISTDGGGLNLWYEAVLVFLAVPQVGSNTLVEGVTYEGLPYEYMDTQLGWRYPPEGGDFYLVRGGSISVEALTDNELEIQFQGGEVCKTDDSTFLPDAYDCLPDTVLLTIRSEKIPFPILLEDLFADPDVCTAQTPEDDGMCTCGSWNYFGQEE